MHRTYYIYQADTYCQPCGKTLIEQMAEAIANNTEGETQEWNQYYSAYFYEDSDTWPQLVNAFPGEADACQDCNQGSDATGILKILDAS